MGRGRSVGNRSELVLLREEGRRWTEVRRPLPDAGGSVVVKFEPMILAPASWALCVVDSESLSIVRVGVAGAAWARMAAGLRAQMWLPGILSVPPEVSLEVELSDGSGESGEEGTED